MHNRRDFLFAGGSLLLGAGLAACGARAEPEDILRVSIAGKGDTDARLLLKSAHLAPRNFSIHYSEFQSGHLVVEAMNGGSLDYGGMSEIPPIFAAASAVQSFRQIAVMHGDVNNQAVLVPKGSPIRTLADLKGKRVGYVRATTTQYFLIGMLESAGLSWADIDPIAMGLPDGAAAFSEGALDAWAIYGFPIQRAIAVDGARILKTASAFLSGNYILAAHVDALADPAKSRLLGEYLKLLKQGFAWSATHQDEWAAIVASNIGVPKSYVEDQFRRKSADYELRPVTDAAIASQQKVADIFAAAGVLPKPVDVRPLWDNRFNSIISEKA